MTTPLQRRGGRGEDVSANICVENLPSCKGVRRGAVYGNGAALHAFPDQQVLLGDATDRPGGGTWREERATLRFRVQGAGMRPALLNQKGAGPMRVPARVPRRQVGFRPSGVKVRACSNTVPGKRAGLGPRGADSPVDGRQGPVAGCKGRDKKKKGTPTNIKHVTLAGQTPI